MKSIIKLLLLFLVFPCIVHSQYIQTPFRFPTGELLFGCTELNDVTISPDDEFLLIGHHAGTFFIRREMGIIERFIPIEVHSRAAIFSPEGSTFFLTADKKIRDSTTGQIILSFPIKSSYIKYSDDGQYILNGNRRIHIRTGEETYYPYPVSLIDEDGTHVLTTKTLENPIKYNSQTNVPYYPIAAVTLDAQTSQIVNSIILENAVDYNWEEYVQYKYNDKPTLVGWYREYAILIELDTQKQLLAGLLVQDLSTYEIWESPGHNCTYTPILWDLNSGEEIARGNAFLKYKLPLFFRTFTSRNWIAITNFGGVPNFFIEENNLFKIENSQIKSISYFPLKAAVDQTFYSDMKTLLVYTPCYPVRYPNPEGDDIYSRAIRIDDNRGIYCTDTETGTVIQDLGIRGTDISSYALYHNPYAFSPDNNHLAAVNYSTFLIDIWNSNRDRVIQILRKGKKTEESSRINSVQYSKTGKYLIMDSYWSPRLIFWNTSDWSMKGTIDNHGSGSWTCFDFTKNDQYLLTSCGRYTSSVDAPIDKRIRLWSTETLELVRDFEGHGNNVKYAEFSPDDRRIVSASLDGTAKVWDVASGNIVADFTIHNASVEYAAFFPDGERVLSIGKDRRALIWNVETTQVEKTLENLHFPAKLSPDGRHLFAGSEVWDTETWQIIKTLDDFAQDYACLTLSPDGTQLLTSEEKGLTKIWNVPDHILKPSGIEHFRVFEEAETK